MKKITEYLFVMLTILLSVESAAQDVPFVPTTPEVVNAMLELAKVTEDDIVYDLGCGDGRIVVAAARDFGATGVGVDSNPDRIEESNQNAKNNKVEDKVKFIEQNLFEADIKDATVIAIYLLNSVNVKLRPKLFRELKPGTRVVSHAFTMDEWAPDSNIQVDNRDVYLWVIPENFSGIWADNFDPNLVLNIDQLFQNVSGRITVGEKTVPITDAKINGNQISFSAAEGGFELQFEGELEEEQLTGIITSADNTLNQKFNGKRQERTIKSLDPTLTTTEK